MYKASVYMVMFLLGSSPAGHHFHAPNCRVRVSTAAVLSGTTACCQGQYYFCSASAYLSSTPRCLRLACARRVIHHVTRWAASGARDGILISALLTAALSCIFLRQNPLSGPRTLDHWGGQGQARPVMFSGSSSCTEVAPRCDLPAPVWAFAADG